MQAACVACHRPLVNDATMARGTSDEASCVHCHQSARHGERASLGRPRVTAATKVSDHWVRSPLLNVNRACQPCHKQSEDEIKARVDTIQTKHYELMQRGGAAIVAMMDAIVAAKNDGATPEQLAPASISGMGCARRPIFHGAHEPGPAPPAPRDIAFPGPCV